MKLVLAFDSFKGALSAAEAVAAARQGVLAEIPTAEIVELPLADGGEGTVDALCRSMGAQQTICEACDPLFRRIEAQYAVTGSTAIIEMAATAGLTLLQPGERNPMKTTTYGLGEMMLHALQQGCTRLLIGIGGSATNDGGIGMLAALGAEFRDANSKTLTPIGENLAKIDAIDTTRLVCLDGVKIEVVCDVQNPLFGDNGAAHVYAAQKGASTAEIEALDQGLRHFANLCRQNPDIPGSGAAGGLGYGLLLLGAKLKRGVDVVLDASHIDRHLLNADLVITGEGKIDRQTLCGKLPFGVLERAMQHGVPVIALAGMVEDEAQLLCSGFHALYSINPPGTPLAEAMKPAQAKLHLTQTTTALLRGFAST